jgi:O-6-methylguanine DNA methyltransferase
MRQTGRVAAIDVATMTLAGPWGPYRIATSAQGVVAAAWGVEAEGLDGSLTRGGPVIETTSGPAAALLEAVRPAVEAILHGEAIDTRVVPVDLTRISPFDRRVLLAVRDIGWGETASYGEVARRAGSPRAARAAGGAVRRNPISMLIPCHRVIAADGTLGGYGGDGPHERAEAIERKRGLLLREGLNVRERRR